MIEIFKSSLSDYLLHIYIIDLINFYLIIHNTIVESMYYFISR